ncbi:S1C family serine protease [Gimesia aquarii]|uniref:Periplasmic pH-dependent serine endoprotease DegQ n=1 Tax=Gimesia aquarii TaxID=2527964 RepID=A0A517VWW1_9PLAN|nr:trypsin-like peptidase domain-containing protein [Gimesia aquarii]QDT97491.1 Periplasmic pH-dependent serine endoprotease DegQ precursor [Gimesia aquarii]
MKYIFGCFLSAILGGLIVTSMNSPSRGWISISEAQGPPPKLTGPRILPPTPLRPPGSNPPVAKDSKLPDRKEVFNARGLTPEEEVNVSVYEKLNKSVAHITTKSTKTDGFFLLEYDTEGAGSGAIIDNAGHILTNYHVIEDAQEVNVTLFNGKSYPATFVGADAINDIAVIKIEEDPSVLSPVVMTDSSQLKVGQRVFAIGNPFGLERTMTCGIISSLNRSLKLRGNRTIKSIIQIDAAVNPGNSGGPLLNSHGQLIGINTAIASKTGQSSGVGFAIPSNLVARVVPQLLTHGHMIHPEIGIQRVYETEQGLLVAKLTPGGPAEKAGIRGPKILRQRRGLIVIERIDRGAADLIVAVDQKQVKSASDFLDYIESKKPGDTVTVTVLRGKEQTPTKVSVTLTASHPSR